MRARSGLVLTVLCVVFLAGCRLDGGGAGQDNDEDGIADDDTGTEEPAELPLSDDFDGDGYS
ncbi:MAG: hypothetical protein ACLFO1_06320, partial [Spirochaetaceae bacterium]